MLISFIPPGVLSWKGFFMYTFYSHDFICRRGIIVWECLNLKRGSRRQVCSHSSVIIKAGLQFACGRAIFRACHCAWVSGPQAVRPGCCQRRLHCSAPRRQAAFPPYSPQLCMASLRGSRTLICDPLCYSIWLLFLQHIGTCLRCIFWPALFILFLSLFFLFFCGIGSS